MKRIYMNIVLTGIASIYVRYLGLWLIQINENTAKPWNISSSNISIVHVALKSHFGHLCFVHNFVSFNYFAVHYYGVLLYMLNLVFLPL